MSSRFRLGAVAFAMSLSFFVPAISNGQTYFDPSGMYPSPMYTQTDPNLLSFSGGGSQILEKNLVFTVTSGRILPPPSGLQNSNFNCNFELDLSFSGAPFSHFTGSGNGAANIQFSSMIGTTEDYQTELLSLNLSGSGFLIRESPTLASRGDFQRTPDSGGWQVSSFFDVFTELSVDGGASWIPASSQTRVVGSPEPSSILVLGGGIALLYRRLRHRRNS